MLMYNKPKISNNIFCHSYFVTKNRKHWEMKWGKQFIIEKCIHLIHFNIMVSILTQYLQKLLVQSVSQPRHQELLAQCKSTGLCWRLISPHQSNKRCPAEFPTSISQHGWGQMLWGPQTDPFCPLHWCGTWGIQTLLYIASKQCRGLITHKPQSIALQTVHPPVLLQLSCPDDEATMTMFTGTLLA
jgi:hypothetical protein